MRTPDGAEEDEVVSGALAIGRWASAQTGPALLPPPGSAECARCDALLALSEEVKTTELSYAFGGPHSQTARSAHLRRSAKQLGSEEMSSAILHPKIRVAAHARLETLVACQARLEDLERLQAEQRAFVKRYLDALEEALEAGPLMCGEQYTLADAAATVFIARALSYSEFAETVSPTARPRLWRYWSGVQQRPSFAGADVWMGARPGRVVSAITSAVVTPLQYAGSVVHRNVLAPVAATGAFAAVAALAVDAQNHVNVFVAEELAPTVKQAAGVVHAALHHHVVTPIHDAVLPAVAGASAVVVTMRLDMLYGPALSHLSESLVFRLHH